MSVVCVYAFVSRSDRPSGVAGLEGERLRRVRAGGIDAIVGSLSRRPAPRVAALQRYDAIERALAARHAAVLPARFGTCVNDPADLVLFIRSRAVAIRKALRLVRHRVQMTVRLFADRGQTGVRSGSDRGQTGVRPGSDRGQTGVRTGSDPGDEATQGTQYLRTRAAEARRRRELPEFAPLGAAVRRWVKAERMERQDRGRLLGSVYHLIPRSAVPAYQRSLQRAALHAGRTTIVSGPWPAYAFAPGLED
ncbi:MAG TPA: GvpL/GvpF family gas vesicle protein [Vicinamibacterales bacterium]|nr:GvpL/GvpF family gas vesicle protein [Vicinamibacterales bacterium]